MINIDPTIFRAYDIRGIVDQNLTPETVKLIGQAIGTEAQTRGESTVIVARDGRLSGPELSKALSEGLLMSGCDVIDIGMVPTPLLYFATHTLNTHSGVMLTGSHNPPNYNGIKIVLNGEALSGESIQALYQLITKGQFSKGSGKIQQAEIIDRYLDRICDDIKLEKPLDIIIDCGNGVAGMIASQLYRRLGCQVTELFCEVDGNFPHHQPDPTIIKNLEDLMKAVLEQEADLGLAFDGDADRLGLISNKGTVIWPDQLLILFIRDILSRNFQAQIVYDVKCSRHVHNEIIKHHGNPIMCKSGHSFIKEKMIETGALLGGEMSGHTFFKERWYGFDDGLYTGARLLELLSYQDMTVDEIFKTFPQSANTPELRLPVDESKKFDLMKRFKQQASFPDAEINTIDGLRADFEKGWGLVRPSNTTPYLILRFEADNEDELKKIQDMFRKELLKVDKTLQIPF
jgi:phosphomannomutase/phosphoglucomutase